MFRYRLLLPLLSIYFIAFTLYEAIRNRNLRYLRQRFGLGHPTHNNQPLWIHAASVGEVNTALPLIKILKSRYPELPLLLTTATPTGAQIAKSQLKDGVEHHFLPLDWSYSVGAFLTRTRPRSAIILETELWPNLYRACHHHDIPLIIINGRLSHRTLNKPAWLKQIYAHTLNQTRAILARSNEDRDAFVLLGAPANQVEVVGNLKFASASDTSNKALKPLIERPYILAASTHDNEEFQLSQAWLAREKKTLLVIAPRHPVRRDAILKQLNPLTRDIAVRSRGDTITPQTRIYLADTLGELTAFMHHAEIIFMGGSLIPHGGQNILEPARLGCAILFGPHMFNFTNETQQLLVCNGARQISSATEWAHEVETLLGDTEGRATLCDNARQFMAQEADIAERYVDRLISLCPLLDRIVTGQ